jgi:hypothetical protein
MARCFIALEVLIEIGHSRDVSPVCSWWEEISPMLLNHKRLWLTELKQSFLFINVSSYT